MTCESCGVTEAGCNSWEQSKCEEFLIPHGSVLDRALSPPFSISFQVVFRKGCLYSMAWQSGGGEAGFLRAVAAMILLANSSSENSKDSG